MIEFRFFSLVDLIFVTDPSFLIFNDVKHLKTFLMIKHFFTQDPLLFITSWLGFFNTINSTPQNLLTFNPIISMKNLFPKAITLMN